MVNEVNIILTGGLFDGTGACANNPSVSFAATSLYTREALLAAQHKSIDTHIKTKKSGNLPLSSTILLYSLLSLITEIGRP